MNNKQTTINSLPAKLAPAFEVHSPFAWEGLFLLRLILVCFSLLALGCLSLQAQDFSGRAPDGSSVDLRAAAADSTKGGASRTADEDSAARPKQNSSPWRAGLFAGAGLGLHSASFAELPGVPSCCPGFRDGTTFMPSLSLIANYNFDEKFAAEMRLGWSRQSGTISREQVAGNAIAGSETVNALVEHRLEVELQHVVSEFGLRYHLNSAHLWFDGGFQLAWSLGADFVQSEVLLAPTNAVFDNGLASRNERAGTIDNISPVRLGLQAGISSEFPIAKQISMAPTLRFTWSPQNLVDGLDWTVNNLELGLSFRTDFGQTGAVATESEAPADPTPTLEPPLVRETTPQVIDPVIESSPLNAQALTLRVFGLGADGSRRENPTVQIFRQDSREYLPLLSQVFFDAGSADLAGSRQNLLNTIAAEKFAENQLSGSILQIYYDNLNIVGERLLRSPDAELMLTGRMPPINWTRQDSVLAAQRTAAVRQYLHNVWGVELTRMPVRVLPDEVATSSLNRNDWREEQQRVEMTSDSYDITAPVFVRTAADRVVPAQLEYVAEWMSESQAADWQLTVDAPSGYQKSWIGAGRISTVRLDIPSSKLLNIDTELNAGLTVRDNTDSETQATVNTPVEWLSADGTDTGDDVRREKFSLILFDYNSDKLLNNNQRILELVRSRIETGSIVTILGYADRTGTPRFNRELAMRRCNNVRDFLVRRGVNPNVISVQAVGSDIVLHDNSLPEGRSYSRTVQILVATPY